MQDAVLVVAACNEPLAWLEALLRYDQSLRGVVIEQWEDGNPYVIKLEDGEGTEVYGPLDDDRFVKKR